MSENSMSAVTERGIERMAIRLYVGWGQRAHGPSWMGLADDERSSWRSAARDLLRTALEDTERFS